MVDDAARIDAVTVVRVSAIKVCYRRLAVSVALLGIVGLPNPATALGSLSNGERTGDKLAVSLPATELDRGADIADLRTRTSRTYAARGGSYETRVSLESLNYRDDAGRWQPIDNEMTPSADALVNRANRYSLRVPRDLATAPVRVVSGDAWIEFAPRTTLTLKAEKVGSEARFPGAWPGVELRYEATADAVKESLIVQDLASVRDFVFDVNVPLGFGLTQRERGAVEVRDGRGNVQMRLSRSTMIDAAGAMTNSVTELRRGIQGWELVLVPDRKWLADPSRQWPVVIDPTVTFGGGGGAVCSIWSVDATNTGSMCGANMSTLVGTSDFSDPNPYNYRLLLAFEDFALPPGSFVEFATIDPHSEGSPPYEAFDFYEMTTPWSSQDATWETSDGTTPWTAPGAELDHVALPMTTAGLTDLVRRWASGQTSQRGILMTRQGGCLCYTSGPELLVQYSPTDDPDGLQADASNWYAGNLGVTVAEASRRLVIQDRIENTLDDVVDAIDVGDFGGTWIDDADDGRAKIGIETAQPTPPASKITDAVEVLEDHALETEVDFVPVAFSLDEVEEASDDIRDSLDDLFEARKATIASDVASNRIELVKANSLSSSEQASLASSVSASPVPVSVIAAGSPTVGGEDDTDECAEWDAAHSFSLTCGDELRGGMLIQGPSGSGGGCTLGFNALGDTSNSARSGKRFILTAGHCVDGSEEKGRWSAAEYLGPLVEVGDVVESIYDDIDAGIIQVEELGNAPEDDWFNSNLPRRWVYVDDFNGPDPQTTTREDFRYPIRSIKQITSRNIQGRVVCLSSRLRVPDYYDINNNNDYDEDATHTICGRLLRPRVSKWKLRNLVTTEFCARPGASGGPIYKGGVGYGLWQGSAYNTVEADNCEHGYFQDLRRAADALDVIVKTSP